MRGGAALRAASSRARQLFGSERRTSAAASTGCARSSRTASPCGAGLIRGSAAGSRLACTAAPRAAAGSVARDHYYVAAAEVGDAQPELVLGIGREHPRAIHRAAHGIRKRDPVVAIGDIIDVRRAAIEKPNQPRRLIGQRGAEDSQLRYLFRRGEVFFHQHRRDGEHVADVVEPVAGIVDGELIGGADRDSQQVADRIVIFDAVQAASHHAARIVRHGAGGLHSIIRAVSGGLQHAIDPGSDGGDLLFGGRGSSRRRHLAGDEFLAHFVPEFSLLRGRRFIAERLQVQAGGVRFRVVTANAVLRQKGPNAGIKAWSGGCDRRACLPSEILQQTHDNSHTQDGEQPSTHPHKVVRNSIMGKDRQQALTPRHLPVSAY